MAISSFAPIGTFVMATGPYFALRYGATGDYSKTGLSLPVPILDEANLLLLVTGGLAVRRRRSHVTVLRTMAALSAVAYLGSTAIYCRPDTNPIVNQHRFAQLGLVTSMYLLFAAALVLHGGLTLLPTLVV